MSEAFESPQVRTITIQNKQEDAFMKNGDFAVAAHDLESAIKWYEKAARIGHAQAVLAIWSTGTIPIPGIAILSKQALIRIAQSATPDVCLNIFSALVQIERPVAEIALRTVIKYVIDNQDEQKGEDMLTRMMGTIETTKASWPIKMLANDELFKEVVQSSKKMQKVIAAESDWYQPSFTQIVGPANLANGSFY
jgi:TPR repeat protein